MTEERFREILLEYGYDEEFITRLWDTRPNDDITEEELRITSLIMRSAKIILT